MGPLPDNTFINYARLAARRTCSGYLHFLPGALVTWAVTESVAVSDIRMAPLAAFFLFVMCLAFYSAAASRAAGDHSGNAFWLGIKRGANFIPVFLLVVTMAAVTFGFVVSFVWFGERLNMPALYILYISFMGLVFLLSGRFWPLLVIPYMYGGYLRWSPSARGSIWHGPSFGTAWRMTACPGTFRHVSSSVLGMASVVLYGWIRLRLAYQGTGIAVFLVNMVFYCAALPYGFSLMYGLARELKVPSGWDRSKDND